jgi:Uma2 family endonuclease
MAPVLNAPEKESDVPAEMLLTEYDFARLPSELAGRAVVYELHHGRLIIIPPPGYDHARSGTRLGSALYSQGELRGHGHAVIGEVGIVLGRDPDHILGCDGAFITNARLPVGRSTEGYLETIPELIAEVRSKNDTLAYTARKAGEWLAAGAVLVWVLDPIGRRVFAHRVGAAPEELAEDGVLTCEDIIPGFSLAVRDALGG